MRWSKAATSLLLVVLAVVVAACGSSSDDKEGGSTRADGSGELSVWTFKKSGCPASRPRREPTSRRRARDSRLDVQYFDEANGVYASKVSAAAR